MEGALTTALNSALFRCQQLTTNVSAQCECWMNQTIVISRIKEFKCQAKSNQKLVTQFKVTVTNTFTFLT